MGGSSAVGEVRLGSMFVKLAKEKLFILSRLVIAMNLSVDIRFGDRWDA